MWARNKRCAANAAGGGTDVGGYRPGSEPPLKIGIGARTSHLRVQSCVFFLGVFPGL